MRSRSPASTNPGTTSSLKSKARQAPSTRRVNCVRVRQTMRRPGSRPSRGMHLVRSAIPLVLACLMPAAVALPGAATAQALRSYAVVGDAISESLTGSPGDATRGRVLVVERSSTCILCHSGPFPEEKFQGDLAPSLSWRRQPLVRRPVAAAAGRRLPPQCRNDHALLLSRGRTASGRRGMARQTDPVGRTDRGYGGVSRKLTRIGK